MLTRLILRTASAVWTAFILSVLPALVSAAQTATSHSGNTAAPGGEAAHALTEADIGAFLDGLLPAEMERDNIAGAVIAVVKDGQVLFARGYGYADLEKRKPVSPGDTLFRPGSISKLFTWTAVMQLVEQGKLSLDRDVNEYLDFKIPATYPQPITLRHIMTHTSGFEETLKDLFIGSAADLQPLGRYLETHLPRRMYPPGTVPAYSNYATAMAGYIVQRVSGRPFDDYIQEHIIRPLGMTHTTFAQPLPASLAPLMSNGYTVASAPPKAFEIVEAWPAGSVSTSALDMTRLMMAHLADGRLGDVQILKPETARLMHSRQFGVADSMNAMCLGFYEETRNGHRIIGHGGDTGYFHSDLHLVLDAGLGVFMSFNSAGHAAVSPRTVVWSKFLDRYFPYQLPPAVTPSSAIADSRTVSGLYIVSRRSDASLLRPLFLLGEVKVSAKPDGTIQADALRDPSGERKRFREIGPLLYREVNGQARVQFQKDASGRLIAVTDFPVFILQRASGASSQTVNLVVAIGVSAILLSALLLWPVAALIRRHYGQPLILGGAARKLRIAGRLVALLDVLTLAAWAILFSRGTQNIGFITSRLDGWLHLIQAFILLGVVGTLIVLAGAYVTWTRPRRWTGRLVETAVAVACAGYVWLIFNWNILSFGLRY